MKRTVTLFLCLFAITLWSQDLNNISKDRKGGPMLFGKTTKTGLQQEPFNTWFSKNYDDYQHNEKIVKAIKNDLKNYTIKAFYGTWCGDSKKELPRFYKLIEAANFSENQLEVYA